MGGFLIHARDIKTLTKFENVTQTLYDHENGRPFLEISYSKVEKKYPKFKFLKFGLPKFVIHGLKANLNLSTYDHDQVLSRLAHFEKKNALQFVYATNAIFNFNQSNQENILLKADVVKFSNQGDFISESSSLITPKGEEFYKLLKLNFEEGKPSYSIREKPGETPVLNIFYKDLN